MEDVPTSEAITADLTEPVVPEAPVVPEEPAPSSPPATETDASPVPAELPAVQAEPVPTVPSEVPTTELPPAGDAVEADAANIQAWVAAGRPDNWEWPAGEVHPSQLAETPAPEASAGVIETGKADLRKLWQCVQPGTINPTTIGGASCQPFRSDDHLLGKLIECPTCQSTSVRAIEAPVPVA